MTSFFKHSFLRKWKAVTHDPFASRSRDLDSQARALRAEIRQLERSRDPSAHLRKTTLSDGSILKVPRGAKAFSSRGKTSVIKGSSMPQPKLDGAHYNAMGLRKLDPAAWIRHHWTTFKKPMEGIGSTENTTVDDQDTLGRLSYSRSSTLLRRERRMARNRFLFMFFAFLALLSAILFFMRP
ncbi:MAG: hypothetical protein ACPHRA_03295 [Limisphaerales bacterium]